MAATLARPRGYVQRNRLCSALGSRAVIAANHDVHVSLSYNWHYAGESTVLHGHQGKAFHDSRSDAI